MRVPVTIVAGFLGAGKTTLINQLLQGDHGLNITVLVNDFGAVNIDAELIAKRQRDVMELSNGCVCCSIQGDLVVQLEELFRSDEPPEYLLIEASGVSQPGRIAAVFGYPQLREHARLDAVVTLVDAANTAELARNSADLVQSQIEAADIIVLTKTDLAGQSEVSKLRKDWLLPDQPVFEAIDGRVPAEVLLDVGRGDETRDLSHTANPGLSFASASWTSKTPVPYAQFKTVLKSLPLSVYRAKGVLYCADFPIERIAFQKVGARVAFQRLGAWPDAPRTQIVGIGDGSAFDAEQFSTMLDAGLLSAPSLPA
ncbi:GTP-binding protein [uncultured Shimia sp.]|uniref:CobW family GTP-binding protein n=1 Tax=uncultured Shimia sp. TaxID=573152 RepID=UPI00260A2607|nr:GTP-binding protein [uncultured Shimia sp.]